MTDDIDYLDGEEQDARPFDEHDDTQSCEHQLREQEWLDLMEGGAT